MNNTENLLVVHNKKLAEQYAKNWQEHERHSEVYMGGSDKKIEIRRRRYRWMQDLKLF